MKKKNQKIQFALIFVGFLLILITYLYFPYIKKTDYVENKAPEKIDEQQEKTSFESVEYKGLYNLDKPFTIGSEKAYIMNDEPSVVYMTNMHVELHLADGRIVNIFSDKGKYNKETYDCFFENNVRATDGETNIFAKNLDLLATENVVQIYNNVKLMYPTGSLKADKIDYNFETKNFKVSMFNDQPIKMKIIK